MRYRISKRRCKNCSQVSLSVGLDVVLDYPIHFFMKKKILGIPYTKNSTDIAQLQYLF